MAGPGLVGAPRGGPMGVPNGNRPSLRKAMVVFEFKYYRYLWISSAFSFTGMQMQQVARALLAWQLTQSYGAVGMVSLAFGLPMLLFSLIGGALSDRMEKRNLVLATQLSNGVLAMTTATAIVTGHMTIELLFVLGLLQGTGFALGMPARTPLMADAVGAKNVMSAIAMSNAAMNATRLIGPALAGLMVALWGIESAYFAQATFNSLSAAVMLLVPTGLAVASGHRPATGAAARGNMFVEIGRGLRYVATEPRLRLLMGMMFVVSLFAMPYVMLLAGYVQEDLGQSESAYGWLQSVSGVGAIIASVAVAAFTEFNRKPLVQWVTGVLGGLSLVMLALGSEIAGYPGAIFAVVMLGLWLTAYQTLNNTMLMDEADPSYYGRVMSVNMLTFSVMPLMAVPLGAMADLIGAGQIFAIMGGVVVAFMVLTALLSPGYTFGRQATREQRGEAFGREDNPDGTPVEEAAPEMLRRAQPLPAEAEPAGAGGGGG